MAKTNYSTIAIVLFFCVFCIKIVLGTSNVSEAIGDKINEQAKVNYRLTLAQEQWNSLEDMRENWTSYFKSESDSDGSLYKLITSIDIENSGLDVDTSKIAKAKTTLVSQSGINIGLSRTCILNSDGSFDIEGRSISSLVRGMVILESRRDISFSKAELLNRDGIPLLKMYDFCVLLRV
ncbi:hypothetical protein KW507_15835 [Vibrio fluvialis]|nr:hypothetical protein [Vibrio fluvialis]